MGNLLSSFFQSGSALLNSNHRQLSEQTWNNIRFVFDALRANPRLLAHRLQPVLSQINKVRLVRRRTGGPARPSPCRRAYHWGHWGPVVISGVRVLESIQAVVWF